nr:multiheme c-type cytochrome [Endozoicomonas sp.]
MGSQVCAACHIDVYADWKSSQHHSALQKASPDNVLGDFNNTSFQYGRVASRFFLKNQQVMVETDGPGEQPEPYKVAYTIGDYPL